jgi:Ricin-type beta-trefoil lectin domain-like
MGRLEDHLFWIDVYPHQQSFLPEFRNNFLLSFVTKFNNQLYRVRQMKQHNLKPVQNIVKLLMAGMSSLVLLTTIVEKAMADIPAGVYRIRTAASNKYLDAANANISTSGTKIQLWDYLGGLNQHFLIEPTGTPGNYKIQIAASRSQIFGQSSTNSAPVVLLGNSLAASIFRRIPDPEYKWQITQIPGTNKSTIREVGPNGKSLDAGADTYQQNGGVVQMFDFYGNDRWNQQWIIEPVPGLRVIPKNTWLPKLQSIFDQSSVRLNNYTPNRNQFDSTPGREYYRPNDSYFRIVMGGSELRRPINIPVVRNPPSSIYIDDMNTSSITAGYTGASNGYDSGKLNINLAFESNGREFWTNCVNDGGCFAIGNRDVQMNNTIFQISMEPSVESDQLTYKDNVKTALSANTSISGCSNDLFAVLCSAFAPNAGSQIQRNVEGTVEGFFNNPGSTLRPLLSSVLSSQLGIDTSRPLKSLRIYQNGDLEVVQP